MLTLLWLSPVTDRAYGKHMEIMKTSSKADSLMLLLAARHNPGGSLYWSHQAEYATVDNQHILHVWSLRYVAKCWSDSCHCLGATCLQGAATQVFLATSHDIKGGQYYADCVPAPSSAAAHDADLGAKLWSLSEELMAEAVPAVQL